MGKITEIKMIRAEIDHRSKVGWEVGALICQRRFNESIDLLSALE